MLRIDRVEPRDAAKEIRAMTIDRLIHIIAGTFILLSLALGTPESPLFLGKYWLLFTAFVGANLLQSGFTRWCLMETFLRKLGVPEAANSRPGASSARPVLKAGRG
jgi:Inner membrane protein YgaP-like, transmembrane domain